MHPMRRKDRMIGEDEAYELLKNCEYAVMSTVNAEDGAPYGVPVSHAVSGRFVYAHCKGKMHFKTSRSWTTSKRTRASA